MPVKALRPGLMELVFLELDGAEMGLTPSGDLSEQAAFEAAVYLVDFWDSQGVLNMPAIINGDVIVAVAHLNRWRNALIAHIDEKRIRNDISAP